MMLNRKPFKYMRGHVAYGINKFHNPVENPHYFVMLRDPVERAISQYYMSQTWEQPPNDPIRELSKRSLMDFYKSPRVQNVQTRTVAGAVAKRLGNHYNLNGSIIGKTILRIAKRNLRSGYTEFGLTDKFEQTVSRFANRLNVSYNIPERKYASLEDRPNKEDLSDSKVDKLKLMNSLDCKLYKYAEQIFRKRSLEENL